MKIKFGIQLWLEEYNLKKIKRSWSKIEELGYDSAWVYDHFYPMASDTSEYIFEPWTILPLLAEETKNLRLGVLVTCNSYRVPSVLAKIAATVDVLCEGRLEFGLGAGWHRTEYQAYGIPFPDIKTRIEQLAESIQVIKKIWTQKKSSFQGRFYTVKDIISYPKPLQKPHPPIWIGGKGSKILKIVAQHADYSNFALLSPLETRQRLNVLRKHCLEFKRDYDTIGKTWHGFIIITDRPEDAKKEALRFKENSTITQIREFRIENFLDRIIAGSTEYCIEKMREYIDEGITYFVPHFPFDQNLKSAQIFIDRIAPALE